MAIKVHFTLDQSAIAAFTRRLDRVADDAARLDRQGGRGEDDGACDVPRTPVGWSPHPRALNLPGDPGQPPMMYA